MFPRHFFFFAICALALLAVVTVRADGKECDVKKYNPLIAAVIRIMRKMSPNTKEKCLIEAAENCKKDWKNPNELIKCAERFFKDNKGWCNLG